MTVIEDIKAYLTTAGYTVSVGYIPDTPTSITLFETGGYSTIQYFPAGSSPQDRPSLQVRVRNPNYVTANSTSYAIYGLLDAISNETINSTYYQYIRALSPPVYLGVVQTNGGETREFSINFQTHKNR